MERGGETEKREKRGRKREKKWRKGGVGGNDECQACLSLTAAKSHPHMTKK